ncbi:hypothetical protein [Acinetobacter baumannii]|uniref:hypothetical protein n=1 Tax=Acinetobacter baumannii TaxID=470 RepID=UPI0013606EFA|nr:hypothetical protein [Acinetobacter baumannii]MDP7809388.1 hypothetical protein [Acinetobacter baumannii]CAA0161034.1 hypothetical protein AB945B12_00373 [Acinetobacter baumannii]
MLKQFQPVTDHTEFNKLAHDIEPIKGEFQQLIDDYKYLDTRFNDDKNPITDGEFDWWLIKGSQLEKILAHTYRQLIDIKGEEQVFNIINVVDQDKIIQDLYDKIHDQRQLKIENDPVLKGLYEDVRQEKINASRIKG